MKKEKLIDKIWRFIEWLYPYIEKFIDWAFPHIIKFIVWIFPYVKRVFMIIKTNIFYIIWFLVYFRYTFFFLLPFYRGKAIVAAIILYGVSLTIAYFFGDIIFSLLEGSRPIETKREKEYLIPIFEEVYQDVKEAYPSIPKIRLHIIDTLAVNAMAFGRHTVAITQGAIETFNSEELKGVIAHEMSHIYYSDTKMEAINTIGNGIITIIVIIIKLFLKLCEFICQLFNSTVMQAVFNFIRFIFEVFVFLMLWAGNFILSFNNRGNEFKADRFAYESGYGEHLT